MEKSIFRQYDIRGKVGSELIIDHVYTLARAIAYYFVHYKPTTKTVVVGMDGRTHSPALKEHVCQALVDSGLDVIFIGVCPTPVMYFALHTLDVDAGLMITASHNTKEYNGIKICLGKDSVFGQQIQEIYAYYEEGLSVDAPVKGTYTQQELIPTYVAWLAEHFAHLKSMRLSVVIDCANGAAGTVIPQLVSALEWRDALVLFPEVDGNYPNHEADPTVEKNMLALRAVVQARHAAVGIGLDGDCDRMGAMTSEGVLVPGDKLLALFAQSIITEHPHMAVVFDIKSSAGLIELLNRWQAQPIMSPSGHAYIKSYMKKDKALLGGELSCHFFFKDRYFGYDDGIYAMLRLLELLVTQEQSLTQLLQLFPAKVSSIEYRIPCNEEDKNTVIRALIDYFAHYPGAQVVTLDGVRVTLKKGWGIVRPSNTQPVLSMRFEADTSEDLQQIKRLFFDIMRVHFQEALLAQELGI